MDYIKPTDVVKTMITAGHTKAGLSIRDLLLRGILSGALLGFATSLAIGAAIQTVPLVGAIIFPVSFVMIVLFGLELVTGSFALVPLAALERTRSWTTVVANLFWVFVGNLIGSVLYGGLFYIAIMGLGDDGHPPAIVAKIIAIAQAKTIAYSAHGAAGLLTVFVKGILCNWMVCMGVVMAMTTQSTLGKIVAAWLPITTFFAQGFEHSVVNMFVIPVGMMFGAKVSIADWWLWNQLPVTLGNFVGGFLFVGLFLYWTYGPSRQTAPAVPDAEPARA